MNYLSKKNLGIPAVIASALAVLAGYAVYQSLSTALVALVLVAAVFALDFDDIVKSYTKQSMMLAFFGWIVRICNSFINTILSWFDPSYGSTAATVKNVFVKIFDIAFDLIGFAVIGCFLLLLLGAISGKFKAFGFLNVKAAQENKGCPNCGAKIENGSAFCTKCGTKF